MNPVVDLNWEIFGRIPFRNRQYGLVTDYLTSLSPFNRLNIHSDKFRFWRKFVTFFTFRNWSTEKPSKFNSESLPNEIGNLSGRNSYWNITRQIFRFNFSTVLDLKNTQLTELSPKIGQLTELRELLLGGNRLSDLPFELGLLSHLHHLSLEHNSIPRNPSFDFAEESFSL